jgi:hypothetical protein
MICIDACDARPILCYLLTSLHMWSSLVVGHWALVNGVAGRLHCFWGITKHYI